MAETRTRSTAPTRSPQPAAKPAAKAAPTTTAARRTTTAPAPAKTQPPKTGDTVSRDILEASQPVSQSTQNMLKAFESEHQPKVLAPGKVLKADHFPGLQNDKLPPLKGAPNYREVGEDIHGVAQPTKEGIKNVLGKTGGKPTLWTNLREEPVVYVNGEPYNLRDKKLPLENDAAPGRTAQQVEQLERDLKAELQEEARRNGGYITRLKEIDEKPKRFVEEKVKLESLETTREVFEGLRKDHPNLKYQRLPVTDLKKPEDGDMDELIKSVRDAGPDTALIFNCHAGQGRTSTAMVLSSLMRGGQDNVLKDPALRQDIKEQGQHDPRNYRPILTAVKDCDKLMAGREQADKVIKKYSHVHDLKQSVEDSAKAAKDDQTRAKAAGYLERYHTLVAFGAYAREQGPENFQQSWSEWKKAHPHLEKDLAKILESSGR